MANHCICFFHLYLRCQDENVYINEKKEEQGGEEENDGWVETVAVIMRWKDTENTRLLEIFRLMLT